MPPEKDFYEPGDPRSFGKPIDESSVVEGMNELAENYNPYTNPENFLKLSEGRDKGMKDVLKIIARDRFFSGFPSLEKGEKFMEKYLPLMAKEYGMGETVKEVLEKTPLFYHEILKGLWESDEQIGIGGLETMYIFIDKPPENKSYEYLGEKIGRAIRKSFQEDRSYKTQAFFGWAGRQVMKKACPETDFSLDRHYLGVEDEKKNTRELFQNLIKKVELGIEGELTLEKCYKFFLDLFFQTPSLSDASTPLEYRYTETLSVDFRVDSSMPTRPDSKNSFEKFWESWQEMTKEIGQEGKVDLEKKPQNWFFYDLKDNFKDIFGELLSSSKKMTGVTKEKLMPKWYEMLRSVLKKDLKCVAEEAEEFETTYFRFIKNKPVAEGYALAQEHIEEILANLPEIIKLPEEEIHRRYLSKEAKILSDEYDYGHNSTIDQYDILEEDSLAPSHNELEKMDKETRKYWALIRWGDNFNLYKKMQSFKFSFEQGVLGLTPLFFGFDQSDRHTEAFFKGQEEYQKFYQLEEIKTPIKREEKRIEELKSGVFALPQNPDDLLKNADLHIERLKKLEETPQIKKRIEVLEEVKGIIIEIRQKGLL